MCKTWTIAYFFTSLSSHNSARNYQRDMKFRIEKLNFVLRDIEMKKAYWCKTYSMVWNQSNKQTKKVYWKNIIGTNDSLPKRENKCPLIRDMIFLNYNFEVKSSITQWAPASDVECFFPLDIIIYLPHTLCEISIRALC